MAACRQILSSLRHLPCNDLLHSPCRSHLQLGFSLHVAHKSILARLKLKQQRRNHRELVTPQGRADEKEKVVPFGRSLKLPDVNPYAVVASQLVTKEESGHFVHSNSDNAVLQRVNDYINGLRNQLEPVCFTRSAQSLVSICCRLSIHPTQSCTVSAH